MIDILNSLQKFNNDFYHINTMKKIIVFIIGIMYLDSVLSQNELNVHSYPIPQGNSNQLFYIQRGTNRNTLVYEANFDEDGILFKESPVVIYWKMFDQNGEREELGYLEQKFAFGLTVQASDKHGYSCKVHLEAASEEFIYLKQIAPYLCVPYIIHEDNNVLLDHVFVNYKGGPCSVLVKFIDIYGVVNTHETYKVKRISF